MSKIRLRVADLAEVDVAQRGFYRRDGDAFVLDHEEDPDGFGIGNLQALSGKLAAFEKKIEATKQHLLQKPDGTLYTAFDVSAFETKIAGLEKQIAEGVASEDALAQAVAEATKPLRAELEAVNGLASSYRTRLVDAEKDRVVARTLDKLRPQDRWRPYLAKDLARQIVIQEADDGAFSHSLVDDDGKPREQTIDDMVPSWEREFGDLLQGDGKEGAGRIGGRVAQPMPLSRDVLLPANATQSQFEAAVQKAMAQGGEVRFEGEG